MIDLSEVKISSDLLDKLAAAAEERDESVEDALESMIEDYIAGGSVERGYKIYRVYPEFPKTKPAPRHLADAPTLADAERLVSDLVAASKPDRPRHYRIVERADRVVSESGA